MTLQERIYLKTSDKIKGHAELIKDGNTINISGEFKVIDTVSEFDDLIYIPSIYMPQHASCFNCMKGGSNTYLEIGSKSAIGSVMNPAIECNSIVATSSTTKSDSVYRFSLNYIL